MLLRSVYFPACAVKKLLVCAAVHAVLYLLLGAVFAHTCIRLCVHACVCVCNVCVNLLLPPPSRLIAFLKSSWFAQSLRLEPHTQQMFHWKGHECLIICVIDAAFLFVSKCERLLGSYVSIFCMLRIRFCVCVAKREILVKKAPYLFYLIFLPHMPCNEWIMKSI